MDGFHAPFRFDELNSYLKSETARQHLKTLEQDGMVVDLLVEATIAQIPGAADATQVAGEAAEVDADAGLLSRAIGNLVRNAMLHGEASERQPATVVVGVDKTMAVVSVQDRGPGVGTDEDVFERFRSRAGSSGHGLGLPLARWIARASIRW